MSPIATVALGLALVLNSIDGVFSEHRGVGGVKFRNCASRPMDLYFVGNGGVPVHSGTIGENGKQIGFQVYTGHRFFWSEVSSNPPVPSTYQGGQGAELVIIDTIRLYYFVDDSTTKAVRDELENELDFIAKYRQEKGYHYVGTTWPRPPPVHSFINASYVGQIISVNVSSDRKAGTYVCSSENMSDCIRERHTTEFVKQVALASLELEVISLHPKVFLVKDFLTDFEADYIINQANPRLHRSTVGNGANAKVESVRTSQSAWLPREHSDVIDSIYQRLGHAAHFPLEEMYDGHVENLNVLNYPVNAEYTPHFDWSGDGSIESRFMTALMYLNTPTAGGGTSFPLAKMPEGNIGAIVEAKKRNLAIFYHLLEDGNADELSLHAGLPVEVGEKWVAPLWIWDPSRYTGKYAKNIEGIDESRRALRPPKRLQCKA